MIILKEGNFRQTCASGFTARGRYKTRGLLFRDKMTKSKKEKRQSEGGDDSFVDKEGRWEELVQRVTTIAKPLASRKLTKKLYKIIKKGLCSWAIIQHLT